MAARDEPESSASRVEEHNDEDRATETSPLLPSSRPSNHADRRGRSAESLLRRTLSDSSSDPKKKAWQRRWPSLLALSILCLVVILIIVFAFFAPSVVERYAREAVVFKPTSLGIDSFTDDGVRARIQGDFHMDASKVHKKAVRDLGRFGTWVARYAESGDSEVKVSLPEYGNVILGTAKVPGVVVDVRNGHTTHVDVLADLVPGDREGIRRIASDWIDGRIGTLRVLGEARVPLKSGLFGFGTQDVREELLVAGKDVPSVPEYDIKKINVHEATGTESGMEADVRLSVANPYPVDFEVPSLGFQILVENCLQSEPYIQVADAVTKTIQVEPEKDVKVDVTGLVRQLPDVLTQDCPNSKRSPLDVLLGNYMRGKENTIYVRGSKAPDSDAPQWVEDLISNIVVPVPLPGKTVGHLIKNFTLADTHFSLPDPFADPDTPEAQPRITAKVQALVALPDEMNFNISANRVRADADVYYKHKKLGILDLKKWQKASSKRIAGKGDDGPTLLVESLVKQAPLRITDEDVFTDVLQDLVFGGKNVMMHIKADVDVEVETALGEFKVRKISAEGEVPVKPIGSRPSPSPGHGGEGPGNGTHGKIGYGLFAPKILDLQIINTTASSITLSALLNVTNPTKYSASIPYLDIHITKNDSTLGHATVRNMHVEPGVNDNLLVQAVYDPLSMSGPEGKAVGREMLSQYISGWNTTLVLKMHEGSLPTLPKLGKALSKYSVEVPAPHLRSPRLKDPNEGDGEDDGRPHFIEDATMHLITSTATFTLLSPLRHSTLYIEGLDAVARYKGEKVGHIQYDLPFAVPPVDNDGHGITSPRLPVDWDLGSVGYEAVKNALGGTLKLAASATVDVRLGEWRQNVWFQGGSIGARVRL